MNLNAENLPIDTLSWANIFYYFETYRYAQIIIF